MAQQEKYKELSLSDTLNDNKEIANLKPHPQTGRLIDAHPGKRTRPMKLLCLGASRTGTMSINTALTKLGFKVYHMSEAIKSPNTSFTCWIEGIDAKFNGKGKPFGRAEFDKLTGEYDAGADVPFINFGKELLEAYPDAKVLLSTRDVDAWLGSMDKTAAEVFRWWTWDWVAPWDSGLAGPWWKFGKVVVPVAYGTMTDYSTDGPARKAFLNHYQHVRDITPKGQLLEYKVQDGWKPLCDFLDLPVPDAPFPRVNDSNQFVYFHGLMWYMAVGKMVLKMSAVAVPVVAVGIAYWKDWWPAGLL